MCGIVAVVGRVDLSSALEALQHRGPDHAAVTEVSGNSLAHARLAILDLDPRSNQPFTYGQTTVAYNGELWNYRELREELGKKGKKFTTSGDTEVFAASLDEWGEGALLKFNGMFAAAWVSRDGILRVTRDRFGEIPLHLLDRKPYSVASEVKSLARLGHFRFDSVKEILPGYVYVLGDNSVSKKQYYDVPIGNSQDTLTEASDKIKPMLSLSCSERMISDVPVCVLLSGGIDSSIIAALVSAEVEDLTAYIAVFDEKSPDVKNARIMAGFLGVRLIEVKIREPKMNDVEEIVRCIEMPYKAQVEIAWPCIALADAMRSDGFRVVFSGEGSDELWASYGMSYHGIKKEGWKLYRKKLFLVQSRKNFARCNKVFMSRSIECRLPFLNPDLVEYAVSLEQSTVQSKENPKEVLCNAFRSVLPKEITKRKKLAFQDGLGIKASFAAVCGEDPRKTYRKMYSRLYESVSRKGFGL